MKALIISIILLLSTSSAFSQQWLCLGEIMGGVKYDKDLKKWTYGGKKSDSKYIVGKPKYELLKEENDLTVSDGEIHDVFMCGKIKPDDKVISCKGFFDSLFWLNQENKRFQLVIPSFYTLKGSEWNNKKLLDDEDLDSGFIELGTCSKL